jgi:hypothetical protein
MKEIPGVLALHLGVMVALFAAPASAQTTVILPDTSQTTGLTVNVLEQATVTIPTTALFAVTNVNAQTSSTTLSVAVEELTRQTTTTGIRLSLRANTSLFTPPQAGTPTWSASDVSWGAVTWTGATGSAGTLSSSAFTTLATCGTTGCSTTALVFTLAPKPSVTRSGSHTLVVTWKIESLQ